MKLVWPNTKVRGRPRKHHVPDILSIAAEQMLASAKWKTVSWRSGTKGRLKARFAAVRVRIADGPPQRIWDKGQQHLPGEEAWLIGEQRASGEKKYYLANLPASTDLRTLAATIKARWICEQAHQQLKEELGLDHFEGRSWQGLHRHALMTMIAYAFLQHRRLAHARRKKRINGPPPQPTMPAVRHAIVDLIGVAAQYASALGKTANCQTLVSLTLARGEVPVMVALRLFLPESWTSDAPRLKRAGVPVEYRTPRSKPEIALAEIDRAMAVGVRFGCVLADAGYGISAPFRQGLTTRGLAWAVGIPRHLKVYPVGVQLIWPITKVRGKPRKRHVPDILSIAAEDMLASAKWKTVSWRSGTKGRLKARFAAVRVRTADGPPQRIWDKGQQHLPGDEAWLIGEQRASGEKKYYLANLPAATDLRTLAATIKARWICEQAHQQLKEELGLDHFEGRSWQGLHRHALMTMIAYAFLQHRRLAQAGRKKKNQRTAASAELAGRTPRDRRSHSSTATSAMPTLQKTNP